MSIEIYYKNAVYDLHFVINEDCTVNFLTKSWASLRLIHEGKIFISGFGKEHPSGFLYPAGTENSAEQNPPNQEGIDMRIQNRNICCFDMQGNFLWQIQPIGSQEPIGEHGRYPLRPYSGIGIMDGRLVAYCGKTYSYYFVNPENGSVAFCKSDYY